MSMHWHWGTRIALVYVAFAASTVGFVVFAMNQDVDLVSHDYYTAAISYDARQAAAERAMRVPTSVALNATGGKGLELSIEFPAIAPPESGFVTFYRPSDSRADRTVPIDVRLIDSAGRLRLSISDLAAGPWTVQLTWMVGGQRFYAEHRVVVP